MRRPKAGVPLDGLGNFADTDGLNLTRNDRACTT
jgi:hypothetical protein